MLRRRGGRIRRPPDVGLTLGFIRVTEHGLGADTDGYFQMTVMSPDRIEMCYAHNGLSPIGSIVATCYIMERSKK